MYYYYNRRETVLFVGKRNCVVCWEAKMPNKKMPISPPRPAARFKRTKYDCKYNKRFEKDRNYISPSTKGELYAYCTYCKKDISISHGGENDLLKHDQTQGHKDIAKALKKTAKLSNFFSTDSETHKKVSQLHNNNNNNNKHHYSLINAVIIIIYYYCYYNIIIIII